jgi:preprotein translocase subunit SecE
MADFSPLRFFQEVRSEAQRVTWPSRRETLMTTMMVALMAVFTSLFFLLSDQIISRLVTLILSFGR